MRVAMLIISGLYLMTPYRGAPGSMPLLIAKFLLVVVLTITVINLNTYSKRAKQGETETKLKKLNPLGKYLFCP